MARPAASVSLAQLLLGEGKPRDAVRVLRDGARRDPGALELIDYLARLLATHPAAEVRNGIEAVRHASHVNRARSYADIPSLMTLAAAYAEADRFDDVVETAEKALALVNNRTTEQLAAAINQQLALFRARKPYRVTR